MADEKKETKPAKTKVKWTKQGEERGAFSEHGQHVAGEVFETEHAETLIKAGFAEKA